MKLFCTPGIVLLLAVGAAAQSANTTVGSFLVANDDEAAPLTGTATFFPVNADGTLGAPVVVPTGGAGIGGGFFAASRVIVRPNGGSDACVYVSNAGTGDIAGIDAVTHAVTGNFLGSNSDSGTSNGIGLAANTNYLYATYTTSYTIGTFQIQPGCTLSFVGDVLAAGLNGGTVDGMAVHGNIMIVTYGDGSIESFDISGGMPVSNGDEQNSTGSDNDHVPNGVTITRDGHFAIFGDASTRTNVEVADISTGKLSPPVAYGLGATWNSSSVRLSPDEKLVFVSNDSAGQVTAAFFDNSTGKVHTGCTSPPLKGYYTKWVYTGNIALQLTTDGGGLVYVPEFGSSGKSYIAVLQFTPNGSTCTLTEAPNSPVADPQRSAALLSIAIYPSAQ